MDRQGTQSREATYGDYYSAAPAAPRYWLDPEQQAPPVRRVATEEVVYAKGRPAQASMPPRMMAAPRGRLVQKGHRYVDDSSDSESSEDEYQRRRYRRKVREARRVQRAHSAEDAHRGRPRSSSVKGRELTRYRSRSRPNHETTDDDKTIYYGSDDDSHGGKGAKEQGCHREIPIPSAFRHPHSDEEYQSDEDRREERKRRKKRILYTSLATLATVATANGVYQNQKGYRLRKAQLDAQDTPCQAERKLLKQKIVAQDAFALLVVGIGLNNVRLAWKKHQTLGDEDLEAREKWEAHRAKRDIVRQGGHVPYAPEHAAPRKSIEYSQH